MRSISADYSQNPQQKFAQQMDMETGAAAGEERMNVDKGNSNNLVTCTPTTGTNTNTVPVVQKTPLSVMSSSLKDRLKKCGRYHPATPPSSRQNTPLSSQRRTPSSGLQSTPTSGQPYPSSQPYCNSPSGIKRSLPQPRNILMEKSNLCSPSMNTSETSAEYQTGGSFCVPLPDHVQDAVKYGDADRPSSEPQGGSISKQNSMNNDFQAHSSQASARLSQSALTTRDRHVLLSADDATVTHGNFSDGKVCQAMTALSQGSPESASCVDFRAAKKQVSAQLTERTEVLRKLNMVKTYRSKNDLHHLQGLIDKWRSVCQQAILDLHQLTPDPRPSLTQLVQQLGIDTKLVCYNDEEECFDAT